MAISRSSHAGHRAADATPLSAGAFLLPGFGGHGARHELLLAKPRLHQKDTRCFLPQRVFCFLANRQFWSRGGHLCIAQIAWLHCSIGTYQIDWSDYLQVTNKNKNTFRPQTHEVDMKMNMVRSFNAWRRYRETTLELNRLSGRELEDIGFTRGDIQHVARKAAGI